MKIKNNKLHVCGCNRAQAVLSLILLMGSIIVLIALSLIFLATSFVNSAYGFIAAQRAEALAASGIYDALVRLDREGTSLALASSSVPMGSDTIILTVAQNSPSAGIATITSSASVSNRKRTITATVSISTSTGQAVLLSWK